MNWKCYREQSIGNLDGGAVVVNLKMLSRHRLKEDWANHAVDQPRLPVTTLGVRHTNLLYGRFTEDEYRIRG
jgi:hypothetical protein